MILYFTGTNNSKYAAELLGDYLQDEVVRIIDLIKQKKFTLNSEKPYIIVAPIYCYRFPILVEDYLKDCTFLGNQEVYCIGTMQSQSGKSGKVLKNIFETKGMNYKGFTGIRMPNNYYIMSRKKAPHPFANQITMDKAELMLALTAEDIENHKKIRKDDFSPFPYLCSYVINPLFVKYQPKFKVNDNCIQCGKCVNECPVENISMIDGKITFHNQCIQCLRCIHQCPAKAINLKKTEGIERYTCIDYKKK